MPRKTAAEKPKPKQFKKNVVVSCGQHLDHAMSSMDETRFKKKHFDLSKRLSQELHFTFTEIESILIMYEKFRLDNGKHSAGMTLKQFESFLHNSLDMTDFEITKYVINYLHVIYDHKTSKGIFQMEAWVRALSVLLKGTFHEKIHHSFRVYDNMNNGVISKEMMHSLMEKHLVGEENPEEATKDLLEILLKKLDVDQDGKVDFSDFKECVKQEPLLIDVFGDCAPSRYATHGFLATFTQNTGRL